MNSVQGKFTSQNCCPQACIRSWNFCNFWKGQATPLPLDPEKGNANFEYTKVHPNVDGVDDKPNNEGAENPNTEVSNKESSLLPLRELDVLDRRHDEGGFQWC